MSTKKSKKRQRSKDSNNNNEPPSKKIKTQQFEDDGENNKLILKQILFERARIKHINYKQRILLLGEGDFSFSASLSRLGFCNLIATSFQTYKSMKEQYVNSASNVALIERMNNRVLYEIDVHKLDTYKHFESLSFDVIIFNFPHTGSPNFDHKSSIPSNQSLLRSIFEKTANYLSKHGELHISLKNEPIYNSWNIQQQCKCVNNSFALKRKIKFKTAHFFGYQHVAASNHLSVESQGSFIWIFGKFIEGETKNWKPIEVEEGIKFTVGMYRCKQCREAFNSQKRYAMHINSKKHKQNIQNNKKKKKKKARITASGKRRFQVRPMLP